jgi:SAM-dependent methyltransferase
MWTLEESSLRYATESVLKVPWHRLPLAGSQELADAAARLWWKVYGDRDEADFYRTSFSYALEQIDRASANQSGYAGLGNWLRTHGLQNILDYGCGVGQVGFYFSSLGFRVDFADLDTPAFRIGRAYSDLAMGSDSHFITLPDDTFPQRYDVILLLDVLEHVVKPLDLIEHLQMDALNPGGVIVAIPSFGSSELDGVRMRPQHLASNDVYWGNWNVQLQRELGLVTIATFNGTSVYGTPRMADVEERESNLGAAK